MVEIAWFATRRDVEFARAALSAAGIPSVLAPDEPGGNYVLESGGARLFVSEADSVDAALVLSSLAPTDEAPS